MSLHIDRKQPDWGYIDLHGLHTRRDAEKLHETIRDGLRAAYEAGLRELTLIHGHGFNRASYRPQFVNSNTGWLGQTVRRILRHDTELRQWMLAKFDCAHNAARRFAFENRLRDHDERRAPASNLRGRVANLV